MKNYKESISRRELVIFLILFILILLLILINLGKWLVDKDELQNSDIILVLAGSIPDRILHAIDIYNQKYAEKILLVDSCKENHGNSLKEATEPQGYAQLNQKYAVESGVPANNILILDGNAKSTQEEALIIKQYLNNNMAIESIILVTSKYHSRRAKKIFTNILNHVGRKIKIYSNPSEYDSFNANQWWRNKKDIKIVLSEYSKLAKLCFYDQFFNRLKGI